MLQLDLASSTNRLNQKAVLVPSNSEMCMADLLSVDSARSLKPMQRDMSFLENLSSYNSKVAESPRGKKRGIKTYVPKYVSDFSYYSDLESSQEILSPCTSSSSEIILEKREPPKSDQEKVLNESDHLHFPKNIIKSKIGQPLTPQHHIKHKKSSGNGKNFSQKNNKYRVLEQTRFLSIMSQEYENSIELVENELQKAQVNDFKGQISIILKNNQEEEDYFRMKEGIFSLISDYGYTPIVDPKQPTNITCQISQILPNEKKRRIISLPVEDRTEIETIISNNIYDDKNLFVCFVPSTEIKDKIKRHMFIQTVSEICSSYGCQSGIIDKRSPFIQCETKQATADVKEIFLPILSPDRADRIIKENIESDFNGFLIFAPEKRGQYHKILMNKYPKKIVDICLKYGYDADITDIKNQIVKCTKFSGNSTHSSKMPKTVVPLPSFNLSEAERLVVQQLQSGFRGIVTFCPEKGFYSKSQMPNFPNRIVDLCNQFYALARIVESNDGSLSGVNVECKMLNEAPTTPSGAELPSTVYKNISVNVPWDNPKKAEGVVRMTLEGNFVGCVEFIPSHGFYSDLTMSEYPGKIIEICSEYNFDASEKSDQNVECMKTKGFFNPIKSVLLSSFDKYKAERVVRETLLSDFVGNVIFSPSGGRYNEVAMKKFHNRVMGICREFRFISFYGENQSVFCQMKKRNFNQVTVELPLNNPEEMEKEIRTFFESGFSGTVTFVPENETYQAEKMKMYYPRKALEICREYNFPAKIVDIVSKKIQCKVSPIIVELEMETDSSTKQVIKSHLKSIDTGIVVFVPHSSLFDPQKLKLFEQTVSSICEGLGYIPLTTSRKVVCSILKNPDLNNQTEKVEKNIHEEKREINITANDRNQKNTSNNDNSNINECVSIYVPSFDIKSAEETVRKAIKNKTSNKIIFLPKSIRYSKGAMNKFPQKIVDICSEFGYTATIRDSSQVVECDTSISTNMK